MKHRIALLWSWFITAITWFLPDEPLIMRCRGRLLGIALKRCGKDFQVASGVRLKGLENICVGNHVYFAPGVVILAGKEVVIEDEVMLAFNTVVSDGNHSLHNGSYRFGTRENQPVRIGKGAWVGANCTVVSGAAIGRGTLIAANSAVVGNIPDNVMVGGVPAKIIRQEVD